MYNLTGQTLTVAKHFKVEFVKFVPWRPLKDSQ